MRNFFLTAMVLAVGCRSAPPLLLERALVTREHVEAAIAVEKTLAPVYETLPAAGEPWFAILTGTRPVLIVAGHATAQTRDTSKSPTEAPVLSPSPCTS